MNINSRNVSEEDDDSELGPVTDSMSDSYSTTANNYGINQARNLNK